MQTSTTQLDHEGTRIDLAVHPGATPTDTGRPAALLLHPWFGCAQMWESLASRLDTPAYAPDWYSLADHVERGGWTRWACPQGLANAALRALDSHGIDQVDVVGNSVGGIVAQIIAAQRPERVRRLVLIGTGATLGGVPTEFGALVGRWIDHPGERPLLVERLVDALAASPLAPGERRAYAARVRAADPEFITSVLVAARGIDLRPTLGDISAPTLVLRGEHDTARTAEHVADLVAGIPLVHAVELAGLGHAPMVEDVDLTSALVLDHLRAR